MKRREFIHKGMLVAVGVAVNSRVDQPLPMVSSTDSWTAGLKNISVHEGVTLLKISHQIFPHDRLADSYYMNVVTDLDAEAGKNSDTRKLLQAGVADLDRNEKNFVDMSPEDRLEALKKIQNSPFFQKVRGTAIVSLYNNSGVWKEFGFAGPSYPFGGYLYHGFDDLNWLPDPPESASPKPA